MTIFCFCSFFCKIKIKFVSSNKKHLPEMKFDMQLLLETVPDDWSLLSRLS